MRSIRIILAALMSAALTMAPVAGAFAMTGAPAKPAMADCHKSQSKGSEADTSHSKGNPSKTTGHCPDCDKAGGCSGACVLKCAKVFGDLADGEAPVASGGPRAPILRDSLPPSWGYRPPAPPPRT